ncbi:hypothetical protein R3P38DRAFT_3211092 [Favolaschia claudopus]|uniref:Uncharacterized protein n=1 Tax=Favolaschia claudopus TaxID=2862362 RepID=A0AAW0AFX5_9AGAR
MPPHRRPLRKFQVNAASPLVEERRSYHRLGRRAPGPPRFRRGLPAGVSQADAANDAAAWGALSPGPAWGSSASSGWGGGSWGGWGATSNTSWGGGWGAGSDDAPSGWGAGSGWGSDSGWGPPAWGDDDDSGGAW